MHAMRLVSKRGFAALLTLVLFTLTGNADPTPSYQIDPVTRYIHITYHVPVQAPDQAQVLCTWSTPGAEDWHPASVMPLISETAQNLADSTEWAQWTQEGRITERRAADLDRTVVFMPYPEAEQHGRVDVDFKIAVQGSDGAGLAEYRLRLQADNTDVLCIEDWRGVFQGDAVVAEAAPDEAKWTWRDHVDAGMKASQANALFGNAGLTTPLPPLSYPLELKGGYAVFVYTVPGQGGIGLRLTGDERVDRLSARRPHEEVFWRWARMDHQNLVLNQLHDYTGCSAAHIDYVRFVPLTDEHYAALEAPFAGERDKRVAGYWEPYSWAFYENVTEPAQHRAPLTAYVEGQTPMVDTQIGRFGMKVVYESRATDPLYYSTIGDPIGTISQPKTDNVGRMQQFTNTLACETQYAREMGLSLFANFGASNCYPGTPLQGDFSKQHPDWMRGSALRYEVPEVRDYVLKLYREALEIGAEGLTLDFCRYPETVDSVETGNTVIAAIRALADEFGQARGKRIPLMVRFPGIGVRRSEFFDYATWARQEWVDFLCPSNIQGKQLHIPVEPYLEAVRGTRAVVMPSLDGLSWGLPMPGLFLWRAAQVYEAGVAGIHVYQADARLLGWPADRRCLRYLGSSAAVRGFWAEDARLRPVRSKGIYLSAPEHLSDYNNYERVRFWVEGAPLGEMELFLDDQPAGHLEGPPYLLGTEEDASDNVLPAGPHTLRVRIRDGEGWLEQTFSITGA